MQCFDFSDFVTNLLPLSVGEITPSPPNIILRTLHTSVKSNQGTSLPGLDSSGHQTLISSASIDPAYPQSWTVPGGQPDRSLTTSASSVSGGGLLTLQIHYWERERQNETDKVTVVFVPDTSARLANLTSYTHYMLTLTAFNTAGDGPPSEPRGARTQQSGRSKVNVMVLRMSVFFLA